MLLACLQGLLELLHGHVGARQMHLHVQVHIAVRVDADLLRQIARAATCAPGDIDEQGLVLRHAVNARVQVLHTYAEFHLEQRPRGPGGRGQTLVGPRREILEAEEDFIFGELLIHQIDDLVRFVLRMRLCHGNDEER